MWFRVARWAFPLFALTACAAREPASPSQHTPVVLPSARADDSDPPAAEEPAEPVPHAEDWLADGGEARQRRRCRLARRGRIRFEVDADPIDDALGAMRDSRVPREALIVADEKSGMVRVVIDEADLRLLLWIERGDLSRVVVRKQRVAPTGGAGADDDGVIVWPGLELDVVRRQGPNVAVHFKDSSVEFSGTLAESALGEIYEPSGPPPAKGQWLASGTDLLEQPGGAVVARALESVPVEVIGEQAKWKRARIARVIGSRGTRGGPLGAFEVVGWVPAKALDPAIGLGSIHTTGTGRGWGGSNTVELPKGTVLFGAPRSDARIGVVLHTTRAREMDGGTNEYRALEVLTGWGFVQVFARNAEE